MNEVREMEGWNEPSARKAQVYNMSKNTTHASNHRYELNRMAEADDDVATQRIEVKGA